MPAPSLLKRDWTKDHVYLVQFPRVGCIPSPSPFALKLETWLRRCDIPYSNVSNNFSKVSSKGQIPFIEVNGRQVADSNLIIEHLKQEFQKARKFKLQKLPASSQDPDANLTPSEKAQFTAYHALMENHLFWCMMYSRARDNKWFASDDKGAGRHLSGFKKTLFQKFLCEKLRKKIFGAVNAQGTGRHNQLEVEKMAKEACDSLENLIGTKPFFFGPNPTTLDITAFGHITQFLFTPQLSDELKTHLEEKCPRLTKMVLRIKDEFWPDWAEAIEKVSLDTEWKPKAAE